MYYSSRFAQALTFAHTVHAAQHRKGTTIPYVSHLLAVAALVIEFGGDENEAIAALLHDAIEDAGQSSESLTAHFGPEVAAIVVACTDDLPGVDRASKDGWQARKQAYIDHLTEQHLTPSVLLVSCADKLANARSILADYHAVGEGVFDRFKAGKAGTLWYYRALSERFTDLATRSLVVNRPRLVTLIGKFARAVAELPTI